MGITIIKDDNVDNNDMYRNIQYASLSTFQYLCKYFIISVLGWRIEMVNLGQVEDSKG